MAYKSVPADLCPTGSWPAGPFTGGDDAPTRLAAAGVARIAAAITARRTQLRWSRAALAKETGLSQHTVGRIEAGRTWPDIATVARLGHALGLELTMLPAGPPAPGPAAGPGATGSQITVPAQRQGSAQQGPPLQVGLTPGDAVTAAHVIEAMLYTSPRLRESVERLIFQRRSGSHRESGRTGTRL